MFIFWYSDDVPCANDASAVRIQSETIPQQSSSQSIVDQRLFFVLRCG
jgi:hypothetical protein